jgi:hypothetical protein
MAGMPDKAAILNANVNFGFDHDDLAKSIFQMCIQHWAMKMLVWVNIVCGTT